MKKNKDTETTSEGEKPSPEKEPQAGTVLAARGPRRVKVGRTGLVGEIKRSINTKAGALHLVRYFGPAEFPIHGSTDPIKLRAENDQVDVWESAKDCSEV